MKIALEFILCKRLIIFLCVDENGAVLARQLAVEIEKLIKVDNKFYMLESRLYCFFYGQGR